MLLLLLGLALLPVAALVLYGFHPIQRWRYRHIPGPRPRWLLGNLIDIHKEGQAEVAARWAREYGPIWCFWMGAWPVVMTDDPELAKKVLAKPARHKIWCLHTGVEREYEAHTLFMANGERWRASRAAWQPFFGARSMQGHSVRMSQCAGRLRALLGGAAASGGEVDIWRSLGQMTMDVVGTAVFGVTFNTLAQPEDASQTAPAADASLEGLGTVTTTADAILWAMRTVFKVVGPANPYFGLCFLFPEAEGFFAWLVNKWPNSQFKRELAARKIVLSVGAELLQLSKTASAAAAGANVADATTPKGASGATPTPADQQENKLKGSEQGQGQQDAVAVDPGSFLAVVGRSTGKRVGGIVMDDAWATNQATLFLSAGYETTANALAYSVYLLANNPDKEARLLAEVDAFGRGSVPTFDDLEASFPYATAVVRESMRVFPPSITLLRETATDWQLGGYKVPAGTALQVSVHSMHHSPLYWREPDAFKPERFLTGTPEAEEVLPGSFLPFGGGSRMCVGSRFAEVEAAVTLACLYQQYTFRLLPGQVPLKTKTLITQSPVDGVRVTVHRR